MVSPSPGRLPSDYQEVEWIEGAAKPAIDTGIYGDLDIKVECSVQRVSDLSTEYTYPACFGQASPSLAFTFRKNATQIYVSFGNKSDQSFYTEFRDKLHTIELDKEGVKVDGVSVKTYSGTTFTPDTSRHIYIFGRCSTSNTAERQSHTRCAYFKIYNNGTLVCDLVPCYRKSDGVIGMYDLVQRAFRTNIGTGTFTKGGNV